MPVDIRILHYEYYYLICQHLYDNSYIHTFLTTSHCAIIIACLGYILYTLISYSTAVWILYILTWTIFHLLIGCLLLTYLISLSPDVYNHLIKEYKYNFLFFLQMICRFNMPNALTIHFIVWQQNSATNIWKK